MRAGAVPLPVSEPLSSGDLAGILGGIVSLVVAAGGGIRWLCSAQERRVRRRDEKLDRWQGELEERERSLDGSLMGRLLSLEAKAERVEPLERRTERLRLAYRLVASELLRLSPHSGALLQAQALLAEEAGPLLTALPDDMADQIDRLGEIE